MGNQNSELDSLAEILWCEKIKRDGGSIAYVMSVGDGHKVVMTHRLERLQQLIKNREAALLSRIKEEIIGEDKDPDTTGRGFRDGHTTRENKLRAEQRTKLDSIAKEIRGKE